MASSAMPGGMAGGLPTQMFDQILSLARDNDATSVRQLCKLGAPPSYANRVGQTALHIGAIWGSVDAVKALLECKANPNAANQLRGSTPLHAAAMGKGPADKRSECVRLMISFKADPKLADFGGELPMDAADDESIRLALGAAPLILHKAVQAKSSSALGDAVKQIKDGRVDMNLEAVNPQGDTALHTAVIIGWREGVEFLIQAGAMVATQNNQRQSPLHAAVQRGDHRTVSLLIAAKADVNAQDRDEEHDPRFSSTTFQQDPWAHRTPLHHAAELGSVLTARSLLQAGADPNLGDSKMETPLHLCVSVLREGDTKLERGTGVRISGLQKKPEWNGRLGAVFGVQASGESGGRWPVLLENEAEGVLLKEDNLQTLEGEMVDLLLEAKADVNSGSQVMGETRTLLHEAARVGDNVLLQKVIAAKADLDRQDVKMGLSALHLAARSRQHDAVRILVEARADLSQASGSGKTAAEFAETNGASAATVALLRGSESPSIDAKAEKESEPAQTLETLTPEQRALLFLD